MVVTTKCHIQTTMTEMNSHGHDMHPIVSIKFLRSVLENILFKRPPGVFDAPCTQIVMICIRYSCQILIRLEFSLEVF